MPDSSSLDSPSPRVLIAADPARLGELADALVEPLPRGAIDVVTSTGGDDTIELFEARKPRVVVLTASLEVGDAKSLIEALRDLVPRDEMVIVLVGDDENGPVRNALDAIDMKPDRFVSRPLSVKALRFAVASGLDNVARALGELPPAEVGSSPRLVVPENEEDRVTQPIGSRTSTPVRGSSGGEPSLAALTESGGAVSSPALASGAASGIALTGITGPAWSPAPSNPNAIPPANDAAASEPTATSALTAASEPTSTAAPASAGISPTLARSPTPQRGSGPLPIVGATAAPFARATTVPRFSSLVEAGDVPPVISRAAARTVPPTNGDVDAPNVPRAPTDRGTGITPLHDPGSDDEQTSPNAGDAAAAGSPLVPRAPTDRGTGITMTPPATTDDNAQPVDAQATRAALRARWEALADSIGDDFDDDDHELGDDDLDDGLDAVTEDRPAPLPPIEIQPRKKGSTNPDFVPVQPVAPWRPGTTSELREEAELAAPVREPTLILHDDMLARVTPPIEAAPAMPPSAPSQSTQSTQSTQTRANDSGAATGASGPAERWSHPVLLSELIDRSRDSSRELLAHVGSGDDLTGLDELDDDIIVGHPQHTPPPHVLRAGTLQVLEDLVEPEPPPPTPDEPPVRPSDDRIGGRDFARQLRAKMSMMAQRLFQSDSPASQPSVDVRPRHDHHTEIDLAALGEEPALGGGVTEIERRAIPEPVQMVTSPGSWDTQVRERGLPDAGEIVRGVSDVSMILARMFALNVTGRVGFRKDDIEKVVFFDSGRPVFASSNEPGDRMGELLVREGKITASQYERCQVVVAQSGRRMGEILVDFGYLKRRELLPAVRRHVEDILYSLFGWDRGHYHVTTDSNASAERIRLSRHPASLVLEGIRRKLDRSTLEKVLGTSSTVIEVPDRERLGGILNTGDLALEERAALAAFDGQADLAQVARTTGVDLADVLPLAWGLCVLGLATARRAETEAEESTALVGETDLAIDRERVRSRWQLVTEADYFALLGVRRDATAFEIRRAYQAARRDFAPDGFPSDLRRELARELEDIASVLDEAFRVLRDDRLRQTYLSNLIE